VFSFEKAFIDRVARRVIKIVFKPGPRKIFVNFRTKADLKV
jgi:hypothetical protein